MLIIPVFCKKYLYRKNAQIHCIFITQINNKYTDKGTTHNYLDLYEKLLTPIKDSAKKYIRNRYR